MCHSHLSAGIARTRPRAKYQIIFYILRIPDTLQAVCTHLDTAVLMSIRRFFVSPHDKQLLPVHTSHTLTQCHNPHRQVPFSYFEAGHPGGRSWTARSAGPGVSRLRLRICINIPYIPPILTDGTNLQYFFQYFIESWEAVV